MRRSEVPAPRADAPSAPARARSGRGAGCRAQGAAPADRRGQQVRVRDHAERGPGRARLAQRERHLVGPRLEPAEREPAGAVGEGDLAVGRSHFSCSLKQPFGCLPGQQLARAPRRRAASPGRGHHRACLERHRSHLLVRASGAASLQRQMGNTDSSAADRDDRPCFERASMSSEYVAHQGNALRRGNIWEAHQARMLEASHVHEFSEIGVYRASCERRVRPSFCLRRRGERGSADGT